LPKLSLIPFETGTYGGQSCLGEELYNKLRKRKFHSVEYAYFPAFGYVGTLTYLGLRGSNCAFDNNTL